jgi:hypothetical protein
MNADIANRVAEISAEFAIKEAAARELMLAERRAARELKEKAACDAGYPTWQAYWRGHREDAEAAMAAKRAAMVSARKETMSQPSQGPIFIDLNDDGPSTSGGARH